ncbi:MAG: Ca2+:H+ antiporter [Gaiellaceae bacterium]|nr:Ca2+:H+ antiporter [Gaiellaceae bacterium]
MQRTLPGGLEAKEARVFSVIGLMAIGAVALRVAGVSPVIVFVAAGVAVAGLAWVLGVATEEAGEAAGPRLSALLNATFGNLPEMIIVVLAIREGLLDVARASIIGSVIGNVLLILGASLLACGWRNGRTPFDRATAGLNATMLVLATAVLAIPTLFAATGGASLSEQTGLTHGLALIALLVYGAYLYASFQDPEDRGDIPHGNARWSVRLSIVMLALTALATGVLSEVLVVAIEPTIEETGVSEVFIGLIIVPLVGNVAEHMAAVKIAYGGNLNFAMGIAFNSALQVALGVTAVAVAAGWAFNNELLLNFKPLELAFLISATLLAGLVASNGAANWIEGVQLIAVYLIACLVFWYL